MISEDNDGNPPDEAFCRGLRQQYGLTMPVLYDPAHRLTGLGFPPNHTHLVMRRGAQVEHRRQGVNNTFGPVIDRLLAEP